MTHSLQSLGYRTLENLASALRSGRLSPPFEPSVLVNHVPAEQLISTQAFLCHYSEMGMSSGHIAAMIELLTEERKAQQRLSDRLELVLSPPEFDRVDARDTAVIVRELFARAQHSILIVSYAIEMRRKATSLFETLATRMEDDDELSVTMCVNVHRQYGDSSPAEKIVCNFAERFRTTVWPGERLPIVYYDPRAVTLDSRQRAVLHAKCVVIDARWSLVTSANFTEAAHERNIEAGLLIDDTHFAKRLVRQFHELIAKGFLQRLYWAS